MAKNTDSMAQSPGSVSPAHPHSEFEGQIGFIQLCLIVLTPAPDMCGGCRTLAPIAIFDTKPPGINCASIVLSWLIGVSFPIVLAPIFRYERGVELSSPSIVNFGVKFVGGGS